MKKILKIASIVIGGIVFLIALLLFLIHTGSLNNILSSVLSRQASKILVSDVKVQNMSGSVFNNFTLHQLKVQKNDSVKIAVSSIRIDYSLPDMLDRKLTIRNLELMGVQVDARQSADSTWNIPGLFQPEQPKEKEKKPAGEPFLRQILVSSFRLQEFNAVIEPYYNKETIPQELSTSLQVRFLMKGERIQTEIEEWSLATKKPEFLMESLSGSVKKDSGSLEWEDIQLALSKTSIFSSGSMPLDDPLGGKGELELSPLAFSDFRPILKDTTLYGNPGIRIQFDGQKKKKQVFVEVSQKPQQIRISGWLEGLEASDSYQFKIKMDSLDGAYWTRNPKLRSLVSGRMDISGTGTDIKQNKLNITARYDTFRFDQYAADSIVLRANKASDSAVARIHVASSSATLRSRLEVKDLFGKLDYNMRSWFRNVDISSFVDSPRVESNLNFDLLASGKGTELKQMKTNIQLQSFNSRFMGKSIENFETSLKLEKEKYSFSGLHLQSPYFLLHAEGTGTLKKHHTLRFQFRPYNLSPLLSVFNLPDIKADGSVNGTIGGSADSLNILADVSMDQIQYDTLQVNNLSSNLQMYLKDTVYEGTLALKTGRILYNELQSDSINLTTSFTKSRLNNNMYLAMNDSMSTRMQVDIELGEVPVLHFPLLKVNLNRREWIGGSDTTYFALGKDTILINHFNLQHKKQRVHMDGRFAFRGEESLDIRIENLDLSHLAAFEGIPSDLKGLLQSELHLSGTASEPGLTGNISLQKPSYRKITLDRFKADFSYKDSLFKMNSRLHDTLKRRLVADLNIPVHFSLKDSFYLLQHDTMFYARMKVDSINTALLNPYTKQFGIESQGFFSSSAELSNTMDDPRIGGNFNWHPGQFSYKETGMTYKDIILRGSFSNERIGLDKLELHAGGGYLRTTGYAGIDPFAKQKVENIDVRVVADNFKAMETDKVQATISSNLTVKGPYEGAQLDGRLTIIKSTLFADALQAEFSRKSDNPNPPLLVQALEDTLQQGDIENEISIDTVEKSNNQFYNNLRGTFIVRVPGNTWVTGKDMNFELSGELRAVKEGPQIDLFGDLNVNRGYYKFYGKRFGFEKGQLTFTGGREVNPLVDFVVSYSFRDEERDLRKLRLYLSGRAMNPDIRFTLDEARIEEKDAIAYILFGRRLENLSGQQTATVEQSTLNVTKNIALGQLSSMLQDALQGPLHLDVLEIRGQDSWRSGKVTVGKYITKNLYLRYEQTFAFDKKNKIMEPNEIALEYQILRSLFLQATNQRERSGFDLIFKKSWK